MISGNDGASDDDAETGEAPDQDGAGKTGPGSWEKVSRRPLSRPVLKGFLGDPHMSRPDCRAFTDLLGGVPSRRTSRQAGHHAVVDRFGNKKPAGPLVVG